MPRRGSKTSSEWRDGFLFLGNHLALDFLNTRPLQMGESVELLPDFGALLRWFQAAGLLSPKHAKRFQQKWGKSLRSLRTVEALRGLRERWRQAILLWKKNKTVNKATALELNRLMEAHPILHRLRTTPSGSSV